MGSAFVALKQNGSVITWGRVGAGGDSTAPVGGDLLSGVTTVVTNGYSAAALKADGSVVTWGSQNKGGDFTYSTGTIAAAAGSLDGLPVTEKVVRIVAGDGCFAALRADGSVISWGSTACADSSIV